jgi:hypothetical protein
MYSEVEYGRFWGLGLVRRLAKEAEDWERLGRLPPEVKVDMAIEMTDLAVSVCAEGIRAAHPGIGDEEVLEQLRARFAWMKRWQRHRRGRQRGV